MLDGIGADLPVESGWTKRLTAQQASALIDWLSSGDLPEPGKADEAVASYREQIKAGAA